jgi:glycine/D-amino acid oxidase-like deaminating enzyme
VSESLPAQAEVVIVGAGVMGCSLAFHLARAGAGPVLVFDRGAIGQGATAACAGGVRAQFSTEVNVRIGIEAKRVLAAFERETGAGADFRPVGYLFLLATAEEREAFAGHLRLQRACGLDDVRELTPEQAGALVPGLRTRDLSGATFCPSDGLAGPHEVTAGYAAAARRLGARIVEREEVIAFLTEGDRVLGVRTAKGETRSRSTVLCAGPWSGSVARLLRLELPITPSRRQAFVTEAFAGLDSRAPMTIDFHTSFYFHPEGPGVLFGMSDPDQPDGFDTGVDWTFLDRVSAVAQRRWPPLLEARVKTGWAGLYEMTPDRQPLVGAILQHPGLFIAAGFSGHGFMMAPVVGRCLAETMMGRTASIDLRAFDPGRFSGGRADPERNVV